MPPRESRHKHCQPRSDSVSCRASCSSGLAFLLRTATFVVTQTRSPVLTVIPPTVTLMQEQSALAQLDPLLRPFVEAASEGVAQDELEALLALIAPAVKRITARGRSPEDDYQESLRQTLVALRQCRQAPQFHAIENFQRYATVVASHVTRRHWRNERPVYQQLKDSLRHTLRNESRFAWWQAENGEWLCGLSTQRHQF